MYTISEHYLYTIFLYSTREISILIRPNIENQSITMPYFSILQHKDFYLQKTTWLDLEIDPSLQCLMRG